MQLVNPSTWTFVCFFKSAQISPDLLVMGHTVQNIEGGLVVGGNFVQEYNQGYGFGLSSGSWVDINPATLNTNCWQMVAFTKSGVNGVFYLNGVRTGSVAARADITYLTSVPAWLMYDPRVGYFPGKLGTVAMYNATLTDNEVATVYSQTKAKYTAVLDVIPPLSAPYTATSNTSFNLQPYLCNPPNTCVWSLTTPPAGVTIGASTGVVTVAAGTTVAPQTILVTATGTTGWQVQQTALISIVQAVKFPPSVLT